MLCFVLLLSLVGISLQGGAKPHQNGGGNPRYQPANARGKYNQYPSQGSQLGPSGVRNGYGGLAVKAGKFGPGQYPQVNKQKPGYGNGAGRYLGNVLGQGLGAKSAKAGYGANGYPNIAAQGGYGGKPSKAAKAGYGAGSYPQYGAQGGYGASNYPQYGEQAGYGAGSYPQYGAQTGFGIGGGLYPGNIQQQQGYGGKPSKAGYRNGYGGYPNAYQQQQQGIGGKASKAGYGNGAAGQYQGGIGKPSKVAPGYPSNIFQQGIGAKTSKAGLKSPLGAYQGPTGVNAKLGAYGQLPYRSQPAALGYDPKSAGAKSPYGAQAGVGQSSFNGQSSLNGLSSFNGQSSLNGQSSFYGQSVPQNPLEEEISPSAAVEGGYQQLGAGQSAWTYGPEESAYAQNGY